VLINPDQDGVAVVLGSVLGHHSNMKLFVSPVTEFFFLIPSLMISGPSTLKWAPYRISTFLLFVIVFPAHGTKTYMPSSICTCRLKLCSSLSKKCLAFMEHEESYLLLS